MKTLGRVYHQGQRKEVMRAGFTLPTQTIGKPNSRIRKSKKQRIWDRNSEKLSYGKDIVHPLKPRYIEGLLPEDNNYLEISDSKEVLAEEGIKDDNNNCYR